MNCTVRFGNCFLRVPMVYQPCCPGQARGTHKNVLQNLLRSSFCLIVWILISLKLTWIPNSESEEKGGGRWKFLADSKVGSVFSATTSSVVNAAVNTKKATVTAAIATKASYTQYGLYGTQWTFRMSTHFIYSSRSWERNINSERRFYRARLKFCPGFFDVI